MTLTIKTMTATFIPGQRSGMKDKDPGDTWVPIPHYAKPYKQLRYMELNKDEILNLVLNIVLLLTTTSTLPLKPRSHKTLSKQSQHRVPGCW